MMINVILHKLRRYHKRWIFKREKTINTIKHATLSTIAYSIFPPSVWIGGYIKTRSYDNYIKRKYKNEYKPNVAFVIPVKDKGDTIYEVLESIIKQNFEQVRIKIIVTDDHSKDNSLDNIQKFIDIYIGEKFVCAKTSYNEEICRIPKPKIVNEKQIDFILIKHTIYSEGKQKSINRMVSLIDEKEYELTATIDADTKLHPDWLKNATKPHKDPKVAATFGWVHLWGEKTYGRLKKIREFEYKFLLHMRTFFNPNSHWTMSGSNILYKTKILKKYPIPEHMSENAAEDLLHTIILQSKGYKIIFVPDAIAYSKEELDWRSFIKQSTRWMKGSWYTLLEYVLPNKEIWNNLSKIHKLLIGSFFALPFYHLSIIYALISGVLTLNPYSLFWITIDYSSFLAMSLYGYKKYKRNIGETSIKNIIKDYIFYYIGRNLILIPYFKGFIEYWKLTRMNKSK